MKANEVPDKIYLFENPITETPDDRWLSKRSAENDIEYTRTDAFIEKAANYIKKDMLDNLAFQGRLNRIEIIDGIIEMFIKAMKGEQRV